METKLFDIRTLEVETERQREFFNSILGFALFTLALTCVNIPNPQKSAILCLFIVIPMLVKGYQYFPATIKIVRELAKETNDPHAIQLEKYLDKKYYGFIPIIKII